MSAQGQSHHFDRGPAPFRSTPINGHSQSPSARLKGANNGLSHFVDVM